MNIYQLVFGTNRGQVNCPFHDDTRASSGIGPNGEFNCFTCGAKAHNEASFIAKYFQVGMQRATKIRDSLERIQGYTYNKDPLDKDQRRYLRSYVCLTDEVIDKHFFCSSKGKLMYKHTWHGTDVGYTWFNPKELPAYSASADKYRYDKNNVAGMLTPYDDVIKYDTLVVTEGEKDMLIAKSVGVINAVAKVGGAKTYMIGGINLYNKRIILVYDCDEWGRDGAIHDAILLQERFNCSVKVIDLGLQDKEDLHDYFIKYKHTLEDFHDLIYATGEFVAPPEMKRTRVQKFFDSLNEDEIKELNKIIKENQDVKET